MSRSRKRFRGVRRAGEAQWYWQNDAFCANLGRATVLLPSCSPWIYPPRGWQTQLKVVVRHEENWCRYRGTFQWWHYSFPILFSSLFCYIFFSFIEQVQRGRELSSKQAKVLWVWLFRSLGIRKTVSMTPEEALSGTFCGESDCLFLCLSHGGSISLKCPIQLQAILAAEAVSV